MHVRFSSNLLRRIATFLWATACIFSAATLFVFLVLYFAPSKYFFEIWLVTEHPVSDGIYVDEKDSALGTIIRRRGLEVGGSGIVLSTREIMRSFDAEPVEPLMGFGKKRVELRSNLFDASVLRAAWNLNDPPSYTGKRPGQYMQGNDFDVVPWWQVLLASSLLPGIWTARRVSSHLRNRSLRAGGRCPSCGYDLRASKDRCPECGTAFPTADSANNPQSRSDDIK